MIKVMVQNIQALSLLLFLVALPISTSASMELHGLMVEHTATAVADDGSDMPDATCCTVELGSSVCNALCAVVDDKETVTVKSWAGPRTLIARHATRSGVKPDPSRRPPRIHPVRGGMPFFV